MTFALAFYAAVFGAALAYVGILIFAGRTAGSSQSDALVRLSGLGRRRKPAIPKVSPTMDADEPERESVRAYFTARHDAGNLFGMLGVRPKLLSVENFSGFGTEMGYALRLALQEKEILLFAVLQWVVIALAYLLWTRVLDWIPDSMWAAAADDDDLAATLTNLFLLGWTMLVVAAASYPISLLNASMTAAHHLRHSLQPSTIAGCLRLASGNLGRLWLFTTIDALITVFAIFDRLPKKKDNRTAADEASYYAWKIGTIGILPALVAGKGYADATKDSIVLLASEPGRVIGLRMAYSLLCWIVGVLAYAGAVLFLVKFAGGVRDANGVYNFYFLMAGPIVVAAAVTAVLLRPLFVIAVSKLYTDILPLDRQTIAMAPGRSGDVLAVLFGALLCAVLAAYFFGDQLGVRAWVESLATRDLVEGASQNP